MIDRQIPQLLATSNGGATAMVGGGMLIPTSHFDGIWSGEVISRNRLMGVIAALTVIVFAKVRAWSSRAATLTFFSCAAPALAMPGVLTGKLIVDPASGSLVGHVCMGQLPTGVTGFSLNRGLSIREVRYGLSGASVAAEIDRQRPTVDDVSYYRLSAEAGSDLCISYVGRFPVYDIDNGERANDDWKGRIAFDGKTIRAADQSRFVPAPITKAGIEKAQMAYDVMVDCAACRTIFWNGSRPSAGPSARFASSTPRPLMLYAGDFDFTSQPLADFIGLPVTIAVATAVSAGLKRIADVHSRYLGLSAASTATASRGTIVAGHRAAADQRTRPVHHPPWRD